MGPEPALGLRATASSRHPAWPHTCGHAGRQPSVGEKGAARAGERPLLGRPHAQWWRDETLGPEQERRFGGVALETATAPRSF